MTIEDLFKQIISKVRETNKNACNEECLGFALAQYFNYGSGFIAVAAFAAEDANYYQFAEICDDYLSDLENDFDKQADREESR